MWLLLLQLRLNAQQLEEKRAAEAAVQEIEELLETETDAAGQQLSTAKQHWLLLQQQKCSVQRVSCSSTVKACMQQHT